MTTITMRIPMDVADSLKQIAPDKDFTSYQTLLKSHVSDVTTEFSGTQAARLIDALRRRGVPAEMLDEVARDLEGT